MRILHRLSDPEELLRTPNPHALRIAAGVASRTDDPVFCEIGVGIGATSLELCRILDHRGELHIFDFDKKVQDLAADLRELGFANVVAHGNSSKLHDSYSWNLAKVLLAARSGNPWRPYNFAFLDGAHTFQVDGPAAVFLKELVGVDGIILFDDYLWTMQSSPTMNPTVKPEIRDRFTDEQISTPHVKLVCDLLMDSDPRFVQVPLEGYGAELRRAYRKL